MFSRMTHTSTYTHINTTHALIEEWDHSTRFRRTPHTSTHTHANITHTLIEE